VKFFTMSRHTFAAIVVSGAVIGILLGSGSTDPRLLVLALWTVSTSLLFAPFIIDARRWRERDYFRPLFVVALLSVFGVARPLFIAFGDWNTAWLTDDAAVQDLLTRALLLEILARAVILVAYYGSSGERGARLIPRVAPVSAREATRAVVLLVTIAMLSWLVWTQRRGGVGYILNELAYRRDLAEGAGYLIWGIRLISPALWLWIAVRTRARGVERLALVMLSAAAIVLLLPLGSRGLFVTLVLISSIVWHHRIRPLSLRAIVVGSVVLVSFVQVAEVVRTGTRQGEFRGSLNEATAAADASTLITSGLGEAPTSVDRLLVVLRGVPDQVPYRYFTTYLWLGSNVVPRTYWPDKPGVSEANAYRELFGAEKAMYPAGPIGDFYVNLGVLGVVLGSAATGYVLRSFQRFREMHPDQAIVYAAGVVAFYLGPRNLYIQEFLIGVVPVIVATRLVRWGASRRPTARALPTRAEHRLVGTD
jgi:hypothetical protein